MARTRVLDVGLLALLIAVLVPLLYVGLQLPLEAAAVAGSAAVLFLLPARWLPALAIIIWSLSRLVEAFRGWPFEILIAEAILVVWMLRQLPGILQRPLRMEWSTAAAFALAGVLILSTTAAGNSIGPVWHLVLLAGVLWCLESGAQCDRRVFAWSLVAVVAIEAVLAFKGFTQRLYGADPAQLGYVAIAASLLLPRTSRRWVWWGTQGGLVAAILMSQTRSVYFAFAVVSVLRLLPRVRQRHVYLAIGAGLAVGLLVVGGLTAFLGLNPTSSGLRLASIQGGWEVAVAHPLMGVGWADGGASNAIYQAGYQSQSFGVYNLYLGLVVAGGVFALLLFGAFLTPKLVRASKLDKPVMLVCVAFMAQGMSEMVLYPGSLILPVLFVALGVMHHRPWVLRDTPSVTSDRVASSRARGRAGSGERRDAPAYLAAAAGAEVEVSVGETAHR